MNYLIRQKNVLDNKFLWFMIVFPFLMPAYFESFSIVDKISTVWRVLSFLLLLFILILKKHVTVTFIYLTLIDIVIVFSTITHRGNTMKAFGLFINTLGIYMIVYLMTQIRNDLLLDVLLPIVELNVYLNLLSIIFFPGGLYTILRQSGWSSNETWFLGLRNAQIQILLVYGLLLLLYYKRTKKLFRCTTGFLTVTLTIALLRSGGATLSWILYLAYFLLPIRKKSCKFLNAKCYFIYILALFFGVVIFRLQNLFSFIIVNFLGKSLTLTGRTMIWDYALQWISKSPFIGWGCEHQLLMTSKLHNWAAVTCHNTFLDLAYFGGMISIVLLLIMLIKIYHSIRNLSNHTQLEIITYTLFIFSIAAQTEGFWGSWFIFLLAMAENWCKQPVKEKGMLCIDQT